MMQSTKYILREFAPFDDSRFELTKGQLSKLHEWLIGVEQRAAQLQANDKIHDKTFDSTMMPLPYYGPIGGGLTYSFVPNGIGISCVVTEAITGEFINLTDFDEW